MSIENEKDLQVWLELYKIIILDNPEVTFNDCATTADVALVEYKKRAKALEEAKAKEEATKLNRRFDWIEWRGTEAEHVEYPFSLGTDVEVECRDGVRIVGSICDFRWKHLGEGSDIVAVKHLKNSTF